MEVGRWQHTSTAPRNGLKKVVKFIDPTQIYQVLANLCINARDAIGGVGKLTRRKKALSWLGEQFQKLKDTASLRYARRKRGVLDVKKTLRLGARYQGIPMEIVFRNKPLRKTRIVTLCDVSGSVSLVKK